MKWALIPLLLALGCSRQPSSERYKLVFPPANYPSTTFVYLIDTETGRIWSKSVSKHTTNPYAETTEIIEYTDWTEEKIPK